MRLGAKKAAGSQSMRGSNAASCFSPRFRLFPWRLVCAAKNFPANVPWLANWKTAREFQRI
jgi:hypothetical protein